MGLLIYFFLFPFQQSRIFRFEDNPWNSSPADYIILPVDRSFGDLVFTGQLIVFPTVSLLFCSTEILILMVLLLSRGLSFLLRDIKDYAIIPLVSLDNRRNAFINITNLIRSSSNGLG